LKVTLPVGVAPPPFGVTVADNVTDCPKTLEDGAAEAVVVVGARAGVTANVESVEVLALKPALPL
jgi:predicted TIM-barrel enzyme